MRNALVIPLIVVGGLITLVWYCSTLIDWLDEYSSGYYADHRIEQVLETAAIVVYTYFAVRFFRNKIGFLQ